MRFFTRCKILYRVLKIITYILGVILVLRLYPWMDVGPWEFFFICVFVFLILCLIMLRCIIMDAEEDLEALVKLKEETDTHVGNPDVK